MADRAGKALALAAGIVLFAAFAGPASAATKDYPPNEQPMYGGIEKNAAMKEADDAYIKRVLAAGYTRASGSKEASTLGFQYLNKGDYATAMKRFNQAWLLDPTNGDCYHGFALVLLDRDDDDRAGEAMFRKALSYPSALAGANADYGRFLILKQRFTEAVRVLEGGVAKAPDFAGVRALYAVALYSMGDFTKACREAKRVRGESFNEELTMWVRTVAESKECR